jgi:hypothetical protein
MVKFNTGDVIRLSYKWPQDVGDGSRDRHSVVFKDEDGTYSCSPITSKPPRKGEEAYAIRLNPRLQKELGLDVDRKSWLKANYVAKVTPPNPSIQMSVSKKKAMSWTEGRVPPGVLKLMQEYREAAEAKGKRYESDVPRHDAKRDMAILRGDRATEAALKISRQEAETGEPKFDAAGFAQRVKAKGIEKYIATNGAAQHDATQNSAEPTKPRKKLTLKSLRG